MTATPDRRAGRLAHPWWALAVAVVAAMTVALGLALGQTPGEQAAPPTPAQQEMVAVSPGGAVDIASLPTSVQELYLAAAADPDAFTAVRCYCGCEAMLDHRHLGDCFIRPDGDWERHAVGCGVCQAEARDVIAAREAGTPIDEIRRDIDADYGAITGLQKAAA